MTPCLRARFRGPDFGETDTFKKSKRTLVIRGNNMILKKSRKEKYE